jgi:hypothetical protein
VTPHLSDRDDVIDQNRKSLVLLISNRFGRVELSLLVDGEPFQTQKLRRNPIGLQRQMTGLFDTPEDGRRGETMRHAW